MTDHSTQCHRAHWHRLGSAIVALALIPLSATPIQAMFQRIKTDATIPCHHQLSRIQDIPYQCWEFQDPDAKLPVWQQSLGFEFGQLTPAQWQTIAIAYARWRTSTPITEQLPPYDPEHHYWLMDFMPPLMQAVNRHRFIRQSSPQSAIPTAILTNCWGTLYEIMRLKNATPDAQSYLMMVDAKTMLTTLKDRSKAVTTAQPGDFLLISHRHPSATTDYTPSSPLPKQTYLDHGALFIDRDLLFEKAGAGDRVPYRLIGLSTIQRIWRRDVFDYQIRRPIANHPLPHPLTFGRDRTTPWTTLQENHDSQDRYAIFPLPPLIQSQGQARLPPEVYQADYYRSSQLPQIQTQPLE